MYRVLREISNQKEVLDATTDHKEALRKFEHTVRANEEYASSFSEDEWESFLDKEVFVIGTRTYRIDFVDPMNDSEIAAAGGGVCVHCHSDNTESGELQMYEGYVTRVLTCNVCNEETKECYSLSGVVE